MKHRLRDADVWAKVDAAGQLVTDRDGRVEIVYKPAAGAKTYRAGARNLGALAGETAIEFEAGERAPDKRDAVKTVIPVNAIQVWTDGAARPNPGPAGIGVVVIDGSERIELSEYLGEATNNVAELTAMVRGLSSVKDRERPVVVYSDSEYSINLLTKNWKPKKNIELIAELRDLCRAFKDLRFIWVEGHVGHALNERCDELAVAAIKRGY